MAKGSVLLTSILAFVAVVAAGCVEATSPEEESGGQEPEEVVLSTEDAFDLAVRWLNERYPDTAPTGDAGWQVDDVTPTGPEGKPLVGASCRRFRSDDWVAIMQWAVVAPQYIEYHITLKNVSLDKPGWYWEGSVQATNGVVAEKVALTEMSEEASRVAAEVYLKNSPTFVSSGIADTLKLVETQYTNCPYCWVFVFEFESSQAGYGERTGQMLAQVMPHRAVITVQELRVASAVMDEKWDMLAQEML